MAVPVSLQELVGEIEICGEGCHVYLNRQTGELYGTTDNILDDIEEDDDSLPEWEHEMVAKLRTIMESKDWVEVPGRRGPESYEMIERFCLECCDGDLQEHLLSSIRGRGAFGRFKDALHEHNLLEDWYRFRGECITV